VKRAKIKERIATGLTYVILSLGAIVVIYPLVWLFLNSLKADMHIHIDPWGIPKEFLFSNYPEAARIAQLGLGLRNSVLMTVMAVAIVITAGLMAAYVFARYKSKVYNSFFVLIILGLTVPAHAVLVPLFIELQRWNLIDNLLGVSLINAGFALPLVTYIFVNYIKTIPKELDEAAVMDGCGQVNYFARVIVPLSSSTIVVVLILQGITIWNDFLFSMVFITSPGIRTLPLLLTSFQGQFSAQLGLSFAAIFISTTPMILFYSFFQRYIQEGIAAGAVKG